MTAPLKLLVVEDEPLIAMMLTDMIDMLGHEVVAMAETVEDAEAKIEQGGFNLAILDVNLGAAPIWPVVDRLVVLGVPFVLATGALPDDLPEPYCGAPILAKPYALAGVEAVLKDFERIA